MRMKVFFIFMSLLWCALSSCQSETSDSATHYVVRGVYVGPQFNGEAAVIHHEAIPGFMEAMQMTFRLAPLETVNDLPTGAKISFELIVTESNSFIQNLHPLPDSTRLTFENDQTTPPPTTTPSRAPVD